MLSTLPGTIEKSDILSGGGEMGKLIRDFDWSKTSLGPIEKWSVHMKRAVRLCITSEFPSAMYCGPDFNLIYNDAYIPLAGRKHPTAIFGLPVREGRKEAWHILEPLLSKVYQTKKIVRAEDLYLPFDRAGFIEEYYCTVSYVPVGPAESEVEAIFVNLFDNTLKIIQDRHLRTLKELELHAAEAKSIEQSCDTILKTLGSNNKDIPFALLYLLDTQKQIAKLQCATESLKSETKLNPSTISLKESEESIWPLSRISKTNKYEVIDISKLPAAPTGFWDEPPNKAILLPIQIYGQPTLIAILIAGISPRRFLNESYINFFNSICSLIVTAFSNAQAFENERKRLATIAELDAAKVIFFSNISHELRTPITLILGPLSEMLSYIKNPLSAEQIESLQMMMRNTKRLLKLVNNILDFSRLEAHRLEGEYEPVDLAQYTADLSSFFRAAIEKANLKFTIDISRIEEPVYIDCEMWEKILFNLLSNAFKYTLKGEVAVSLKRVNRHIELNVSDTGVGIGENDLPHIFDRFYRARATQARSHEGAGIGLSLAYELVKLHGGTITVRSAVNKGTTFTIRIPLGKEHLPAGQIKSAKTVALSAGTVATSYVDEAISWLPENQMKEISTRLPPIAIKSTQGSDAKVVEGKKDKILIVDDNVDMRIYFRNLLSPHWEVLEAGSYDQALEISKMEKPKLIVSDVVMGPASGLDLVKKMRQEAGTRLTPIILVSASISEEARKRGFDSGADDYLNKPFSGRELLARVRTQLELGKIRGELEVTIDELKKANTLLFKSEESYRVLTTMSPVGILHIDQNGLATYVNPKGKVILGLSESATLEDVNSTWIGSLHPDDKERVVSTWRKTIEAKLDHFKAEYRFVHKDQSVVWVIGEAMSEKDSAGKIIGYILTLADITRIKELLDRQVHVIDSLCHELRNPLSAISGHVRLLLMHLQSLKAKIQSADQAGKLVAELKNELEQCSATGMESIDAISKCLEHQTVITNDVLEMSKLEASMVRLNERQFDPYKKIKDVIAMKDAEIKEKELKIEVSHTVLDYGIISDPDRIKEVLLNLLSNAIKFTEKRGMIKIGFKMPDESTEECSLEFFVEDTGIGIPEDKREKIFDRFFKADHRTFVEYGGSGLGLSICKRLVELMGGKINLTSEVGKGSRFSFTIKCKKVAKEKKHIKEAKSKLPKEYIAKFSGLSALIVEDNLINQKILKKLVEQYGITCYVANNGEEAVNFIKQKSKVVQIVFMDIEMPKMNGLDATKAIREFEKVQGSHPLYIIGISAYARAEYQCSAKECGMNSFYTKPYDITQLVSEIEQNLDKIHKLETSAASASQSQTSVSSGSSLGMFSSAETSSTVPVSLTAPSPRSQSASMQGQI